MIDSPPIHVISSSVCPWKSFAVATACGPRNHVSPRPETRIAKPWHENVIAVTTVEPSMPCAASQAALQAAIESRRK